MWDLWTELNSRYLPNISGVTNIQWVSSPDGQGIEAILFTEGSSSISVTLSRSDGNIVVKFLHETNPVQGFFESQTKFYYLHRATLVGCLSDDQTKLTELVYNFKYGVVNLSSGFERDRSVTNFIPGKIEFIIDPEGNDVIAIVHEARKYIISNTTALLLLPDL